MAEARVTNNQNFQTFVSDHLRKQAKLTRKTVGSYSRVISVLKKVNNFPQWVGLLCKILPGGGPFGKKFQLEGRGI